MVICQFYDVCFDFADVQLFVAKRVPFDVACELSEHEEYYYILQSEN